MNTPTKYAKDDWKSYHKDQNGKESSSKERLKMQKDNELFLQKRIKMA